MILIIDNYDSFTYNLFQYAGELGEKTFSVEASERSVEGSQEHEVGGVAVQEQAQVRVVLNNELSVEEIDALSPSHIIISSGPGRPESAGICLELINELGGRYPILGIGLGHKAIAQAYGARIEEAQELMHGKTCDVHIANGSEIFQGLAPLATVARYDSLIVNRESIPDELFIIAETKDGEVMGIKHRDQASYGLQFHPESIMTETGKQIIENFLSLKGVESRD